MYVICSDKWQHVLMLNITPTMTIKCFSLPEKFLIIILFEIITDSHNFKMYGYKRDEVPLTVPQTKITSYTLSLTLWCWRYEHWGKCWITYNTLYYSRGFCLPYKWRKKKLYFEPCYFSQVFKNLLLYTLLASDYNFLTALLTWSSLRMCWCLCPAGQADRWIGWSCCRLDSRWTWPLPLSSCDPDLAEPWPQTEGSVLWPVCESDTSNLQKSPPVNKEFMLYLLMKL